MTSILPKHIAIVMDGNGRWAKQRKLPVAAGHKAGVEAVRSVLELAKDAGVHCLTLYAFSSENWQRPKLEVSALMTLFSSYLDSEVERLAEQGVALRFIGRRDKFDAKLLNKIRSAEQKTAANSQFFLNLAVDYGGRDDICQAVQALAQQVEAGQLKASQIDQAMIAEHVALADLPEPDLFIRTSGEHRISNFLLWQLSYAELYFSDALWPDFDAHEFQAALASYAQRDRRFGARPDTDDNN